MIRKVLYLLLFVTFISLSHAHAQCAMCTQSTMQATESNVNKKAMGINRGILYLLAMPFSAVGVVGFIWYQNARKGRQRITIPSNNKYNS